MHTAEPGSFGHAVSGFKGAGGKLWNLTLWLKGTEARRVAGESLCGGASRPDAVKVKPGLSWRPRMVEMPAKEAADRMWNQAQPRVLFVRRAGGEVIRHGVNEFGVCLTGFFSCFGLVISSL